MRFVRIKHAKMLVSKRVVVQKWTSPKLHGCFFIKYRLKRAYCKGRFFYYYLRKKGKIMLDCIKTNKICERRKCKVCKFDNCREVIEMLDVQEKNINRELRYNLIKNLPEQCKNCSFLEVIDLKNQKVRCFYLPKNECLKGKS